MGTNRRTIVVGVDASEHGRVALDWARVVAGPDDRIIAVHAWEMPAIVTPGGGGLLPVEDLGELAERGIAELIDELDDPRIEGVVAQGHPGRSIIEESDDRGGDLIVVGQRGSGRASVILGSTASYVIHHTETPTAVIRGTWSGAPDHVVVGAEDHDLDDGGTNESVRALQWAYGLSGARRIDVVHAWFVPALVAGPFSTPGADFEEYDRAAVEVSQRVIDAAGPVPDGVAVNALPANGTPEFALIELSLDADLVVAGSRGRGGFAGLILGSTSLDLVTHSHAPVVIVR